MKTFEKENGAFENFLWIPPLTHFLRVSKPWFPIDIFGG